MGDIIEKRRRDYSGLDADKASIPAGGKSVNDTFLATDTKILYFWDGVAWIIIPLDVIVAGMIKTDAIETLKIKDINVTAAKLATNSVETAKIKNLNVTVDKLAGGITAGKLAADCVETAKIKDLNVTKAKAELGFGRYVPRAVAAADFALGDFPVKDGWQADGLDLTGIVPEGIIGIHILAQVRGTAADLTFGIKANGTTKEINKLNVVTQVANLTLSYMHGIIYVDADRLADYYCATNINTAEVSILGWFI